MNEITKYLLKSFIGGVVFGLGFFFSIALVVLILFNKFAPYIKEFLTNIN